MQADVGSGGEASALASSATHMGQQLYRSALRAATSAAKSGAQVADAGEGPFAAQAIKAGRRPPDSLVQQTLFILPWK